MSKKKIGNKGESKAAEYLKKKKYKIEARNVHTKYGEIDIVATLGDTYIFVEVKLRSSEAYGKGYEAVDRRKQLRIIHSAELYCQDNHINALCRFDVISIDGESITHIENAFH